MVQVRTIHSNDSDSARREKAYNPATQREIAMNSADLNHPPTAVGGIPKGKLVQSS